MTEILGADLDKAFQDLQINAKKTYQQTKIRNEYSEVYQVWELTLSEFQELSKISECDWQDDWGWWRYALGSSMCNPIAPIIINGEKLAGWYNEDRFNDCIKDYLEDIMECNPELDRGEEEQKLIEDYYKDELIFEDLSGYFCGEFGISQPRNVCALAVDLARMNGIKMSELFRKYQG